MKSNICNVKIFLSYLVAILIIVSCSQNRMIKKDTVRTKMLNAIKYEESLGVDSISESSQKYYTEFESAYLLYKADRKKIDTLKPLLNKVRFVVFGGSWCSDTRRELPRLSKILDKCNFDVEEFLYFGVNKNKEVYFPTDASETFKFRFVPAILILRDNIEIGRIVENPLHGSLENDLLFYLRK